MEQDRTRTDLILDHVLYLDPYAQPVSKSNCFQHIPTDPVKRQHEISTFLFLQQVFPFDMSSCSHENIPSIPVVTTTTILLTVHTLTVHPCQRALTS
jgi:hypothetical protein